MSFQPKTESYSEMETNTEDEKKADSDEAKLSQLGYKQELKRHLTMLENFAFSFSIISVLTGITTTYNTGLRYGGPVSVTLGWLLVSFFNGCVALSMAEICSAYPTAGGLYYWSAKLSGRRWAPLASWITGWFNIVGQWAGITSIDFSLAQMLQVIILLSTGGANGGGYLASKYAVLGCYAAILIIHGAINSISVKWVSFLCQLGAVWNVIGVFLLTILIPSVATEKASPKFVFAHFNPENDAGIHNKFYIFVLGLLMSQYTMGGYDASVHMTEETKNADINGPKGIINSVAISTVAGYMYLISITFTVRNIPYLLRSDNDAGGYAIAEVFYLVFKNRYGSGVGGIICLGFIAVAVFFCGIGAVASNSRMTYAFSRDGAMPFSSLWCKVNKEEVPANAVWLALAISFCMATTVHPVLMVIGFVLLNGEAILAYRTVSGTKNFKKAVHLTIQLLALFLGSIGIWAALKFHNDKGIDNFYSLHSWLGLACFFLFAIQLIAGFATFWYPGGSRSSRSFLLPWHVFFGLYIYALALATVFTGLLEKATFLQMNNVISRYSSEAFLVNSLGILLVVLGGTVVLAVITPLNVKSDGPRGGME